VGAYTYSQGLEWAVESGAVRDEASAGTWIGHSLEHGMARGEAVYLTHMLAAWEAGDHDRLARLDAEFLASRETAELRAETLQMGHSLARLLRDLGVPLDTAEETSFPRAWSRAAAHWNLPAGEAVAAYLWAWLENQVMAALKAVPLGQTTGQRLLLRLGERLPELAGQVLATCIDQTRNFLPAYAIAGCLHETQYTRIFRS
jgi:urease accessory protein